MGPTEATDSGGHRRRKKKSTKNGASNSGVSGNIRRTTPLHTRYDFILYSRSRPGRASLYLPARNGKSKMTDLFFKTFLMELFESEEDELVEILTRWRKVLSFFW